jgi:5-oxoprolinase (ATP-hydrolysing)
MPPFSKNLAEEGVLIRNFKLVEGGKSRFDELRDLLSSGPYPSRSVETNVADITAQLAANHQGAEDLRRMIAQHSLPVVQAYMRHIQDAAERKMRSCLSKLPPGKRDFAPQLRSPARERRSILPGRAPSRRAISMPTRQL